MCDIPDEVDDGFRVNAAGRIATAGRGLAATFQDMLSANINRAERPAAGTATTRGPVNSDGDHPQSHTARRLSLPALPVTRLWVAW